MRNVGAFTLSLFLLTVAFGQNEQAPVVERDIEYKDWTYRSVSTSSNLNLRSFAKGKKLVLVAYVAPRCWEDEAVPLQYLYKRYHSKGFQVIAVAEYSDWVMKTEIEDEKITFPIVYRSGDPEAQNPLHYRCSVLTGNAPKVDPPWGIFLTPASFREGDETLATKTFVVPAGAAISRAEDHIRKQLGLKPLPVPKGMQKANIFLQLLCIFCQ